MQSRTKDLGKEEGMEGDERMDLVLEAARRALHDAQTHAPDDTVGEYDEPEGTPFEDDDGY